MESFDANKLLPQNIIIKSAETHSYRIGLSFDSLNYVKRDILHNPLLIFIITTIGILKVIIQWLLPDDNPQIFHISRRLHLFSWNQTSSVYRLLFYMLLSLTSQIIYYYNYKNDIKPTFLKVFQMMSGLVSPKSIGLTNKEQIYKLVKTSKRLFTIFEFISKILNPLIVFLLNLKFSKLESVKLITHILWQLKNVKK